MTGERMMFDDMVQRIYTDNGRGNGHLDIQAWQKYLALISSSNDPTTGETTILSKIAAPAMISYAADRKELNKEADRLYGLLDQELLTPIWQQPESLLDRELEQMHGASKYQLLFEIMPALGAVRRTGNRFMARADGLLVGLALEAYHAEFGSYPDSLDALAPSYLPKIPVDRMVGGPINYTLIDGKPVVYSVGADRDDDGGVGVFSDDGDINYEVTLWSLSEDETAIDGDWVVWPAFPKPEPRGFEDHPDGESPTGD